MNSSNLIQANLLISRITISYSRKTPWS